MHSLQTTHIIAYTDIKLLVNAIIMYHLCVHDILYIAFDKFKPGSLFTRFRGRVCGLYDPRGIRF